jgi:hypothetical protein
MLLYIPLPLATRLLRGLSLAESIQMQRKIIAGTQFGNRINILYEEL